VNQNEKIGKVGLNEMAEKLGVSVSTVSRALNDHPKISKLTKERVVSLAVQMGYKSGVPSLFSETRSNSIALILPNVIDGYFSEILTAVREACAAQKMALFVCESHYNPESENQFLEQIELMKFQGAIYVAHENSDKVEVLDRLIEKSFPLVFINECPGKAITSSVLVDVYQSLSDSIAHLKSNGAEKITLVLDDIQNPINHKIENLFKPILEGSGLRFFQDSIVHLKHPLSDFARLVKAWESGKSLPDAILVGSRNLALGIQKSMQHARHLSKKNCMLICLRSETGISYTRSKLTYLNLCGKEMGKDAAQLLFDQLNDDVKSKIRLHFSKLIIKSSSIKKG
jgi:LacI family transcriptional regulator